MQLLVHASPEQREAFLSRPIPAQVTVAWYEGELLPADAYFDLHDDAAGNSVFERITTAPVFVNAVVAERAALAPHLVRMNAWPGFLTSPRLELACAHKHEAEVAKVMSALGWQYQLVPDLPGMIAPRVIAMIINEAWFAWGDGVSSKEEIDTAMKLGTNYPYGPFEWGEKIGINRIYSLLKALGSNGKRYEIAPALTEAWAACNK